jgi:hypothetical protein
MFSVIFKFCGYTVHFLAPNFSPMISQFRLVQKGSGNFKSKLYFLQKMALTKEQLNKPILRKLSMSKRKEESLMNRDSKNRKNLIMDKMDDFLV